MIQNFEKQLSEEGFVTATKLSEFKQLQQILRNLNPYEISFLFREDKFWTRDIANQNEINNLDTIIERLDTIIENY